MNILFKADLKPMEETIAEKDVGVTIDNKLSFDKHITEKVNKANSIIGDVHLNTWIWKHSECYMSA